MSSALGAGEQNGGEVEGEWEEMNASSECRQLY